MKHLRLLILMLMLAISTRVYAESATDLEYKVKAVVLFNFAKYVRWPESVFKSADQPIRVCILGENPFGEVFNSSDAPKDAQNRPLSVVELPSSATKQDVASCQILYWKEKYESTTKPLHTTLEENSVLTVSDVESDNALISFTLVDGKVRFKIRHKAAEALKLGISSQLLKLAILED